MVRYKEVAVSAVAAVLVTCALMGAAWATAQSSGAATISSGSRLVSASPQ